ncbi:MAG: PIN domain-containing protein [Thermoplasmatota archaeon]
MIVGDSDFFVDLLRSGHRFHARAATRARALDEAGEAVFMTALTRFELFSGSEQFVRPAEERARVQSLLERHAALPLTPAGADRAGRIHGTLTREGNAIGVVDALIAATALENDLPVLTRNARHFERIQGLRIEPY